MTKTISLEKASGTLKAIRANIHGHNKHIPKEKLDAMGIEELLANTHPLDRVDFARQLYRNDVLKEADLSRYVKAHQKWIDSTKN